MLIHDYEAFTIWKTRELEIERKNKLELMLRAEEQAQPTSAKRIKRIQQFVSLLIRKQS